MAQSGNRVLRGSVSNVVRLGFTALASVLLPKVLVGHLAPAEYSAWVLLLQLAAYVGLLDLGLQVVVTKFVAEYHAKGDHRSGSDTVSGAVSLLGILAVAGAIGIGVVAWQAGALLPEVPRALLPQVQAAILLVGLSNTLALPFGPFLATFGGLQRYGYPTVLAIVSKLASAAVLMVLAALGADVVQLAVGLATVNVLTVVAQFVGWHRMRGRELVFRPFWLSRPVARRLLGAGSVIALWSVGGLFVSGLDVVIVGRFDFAQTGYYGIAATAAGVMLSVLGALFAPVMPAISALSGVGTPSQVGDAVVRVTRLCTLVVLSVGTVLVVFAHPILVLWVGPVYAQHATLLLQLLVVGTGLRQLGAPYSTATIATGRQAYATVASMSEAVVNFGVSLWLVQAIGAPGVALGTCIGAVVSVGLHFVVSMPATQGSIRMSRGVLLRDGFLRPAFCFLPAAAAATLVAATGLALSVPAALLATAAIAALTAALVWRLGLGASDRAVVAALADRVLPAAVRQRA